MKSFLYEIPREFMPTYRFLGDAPRIKVKWDLGQLQSVEVWAQYAPAILWDRVIPDLEEKVKQLWQESLASVDITPGDGCEHSDQMIP